MRTKLISTLLGLLIINCLNVAQITVNAVGDVMLGSVTPKTILPPNNGEEFVKAIGEYLIGADIVFGNLEGSLISNDLKRFRWQGKNNHTVAEHLFDFTNTPTIFGNGFVCNLCRNIVVNGRQLKVD